MALKVIVEKMILMVMMVIIAMRFKLMTTVMKHSDSQRFIKEKAPKTENMAVVNRVDAEFQHKAYPKNTESAC